jgi:hypothetical protein
MSAQQTNNARLFKALRQGPVSVTDWTGPNTPDGGPPILRVAARVKELRSAGFPIERTGTYNACAVYELVNRHGCKEGA